MTSRVSTKSFNILTPLLAFEQVFRRTGTIRKTCILQNLTDRQMQLRIRYGFREHSWFQLYKDTGDGIERGEVDRLTVEPGQTRIHVLMNTDSSNFPYDRFRGRIHFEEPDSDRTAQWLEVSFEQIEDLRDFVGYAAIDLGTSNSMMALYHLENDAVSGAPWNPSLEADETEVPSTVFIRDLAQFRKLAEGSCSVGRTALSEYASNPINDPRSLQMGVKRLIGIDRLLAADAQGAGGYVDPLNILYILGRFIRERSQAHDDVRACLRKLIVTFPPTWDYRQINRWKEIFKRLGFGEDDLDLSLDEASAAGLFYIYQWMKDEDSRNRLFQDLMHSAQEVTEQGRRIGDRYLAHLLCFDFGGGTIDLALIRVQLTVLEDIIRMRITLEASDSLNYGGDQVTLVVFRILKRRLAMGLSDPQRLAGARAEEDNPRTTADEAGVDSSLFLLPSPMFVGRGRILGSSERGMEVVRKQWEEIEEHISNEQLPGELEDAVDAVFSTRFWKSTEEPISPNAKQNFGWLWERAESLKRELFVEASQREKGIALVHPSSDDIRAAIPLKDLPEGMGSEIADAKAWVSVEEIYRAISAPLGTAMDRARQLVKDVEMKIDRVVLTGQSSWIPLVRRLFMRPRSEGGFGMAPNRVEFDEANAKAAVSKGACLLRVLRDTLVGFDVDISDFKANLLAEIFYKSPMTGKRTLFAAGPIDDLHYVEDSPDPSSFARHLSVFYSSPRTVLGQFDFGVAGDELPGFAEHARKTEAALSLSGGMTSHADLARQREKSPEACAEIVTALRDWPERAIVSWIEDTAAPGSEQRPIYRYYLSKNRNLLAVRDRGKGHKQLFALRVDDRTQTRVRPQENPFSGIH